MASARMEPVGSFALKGMEGIAQFFANLAEGILDYKELNTNHEVKAIMHHIAVKHMPFTDKIDELSKAGSAIEDPEERKRFMDAVEQVEQEGHKVKEGLDEIRRYVRKSGMSEQDRARMLKEVDRCEQSLQNLYVANVPAYTYKQTMKLVNQNGFMRDVTAVTLSNGNYALFYPMEHVEKMDKILESAALMYEQHPRPESVKTEALMTASIKADAAVLRFENVSPELAERAVLEGGKYGFISMAKEERMDGSGKFDLICKAGETKAERNRNYREAIEIITKSAMSLAGPASQIEQAKMRHSAREYDALMEGLQESGYVFSVHTRDVKVGDKRSQLIDVGEFVKFDQEKYRSYHDGIAEKLVVNRSEADTRYDAMLYAAVQAGTGQKIYISDARMKELQTEGSRVYMDLMQQLEGKMVGERLNVMASLQEKHMELMEKRQEYKKEGNHAMQDAVTNEMRAVTAQIEVLSIAGVKPITETMVFDRVVAGELDTHRFRQYSRDSEMADAAKVMQKAVDYCVRSTRPEAAEETVNRLRREIVGDGKDLSIGWEQIETELERIQPSDFISHELQKASADKDNLEPGKLSISDVKRESDILDREFNKTKSAAADMLKDIRIRMQEVEMGMDIQNIETPASARNARLYQKNIGDMDRELTGMDAEPEQVESFKETRKSRIRETRETRTNEEQTK